MTRNKDSEPWRPGDGWFPLDNDITPEITVLPQPIRKTLKDYQAFVKSVTNPEVLKGSHAERCVIAALGLCGESGKVADHVKKHVAQGHPFKLASIVEELGDIMFYIADMCNANNIPMDDVMDINVAKLQRRYPNGFTTKRSIYREK